VICNEENRRDDADEDGKGESPGIGGLVDAVEAHDGRPSALALMISAAALPLGPTGSYPSKIKARAISPSPL
jgi:hypothetical protein